MIDKAAVREAYAHAADLERQILARWPDAWAQMDRLRREPPMAWPDWCLLPMAAAAAITGTGITSAGPPPIAAVSALYAWRYTRSVYVVHDDLMARLLTNIPDALDLDALVGLPQWCLYVIGAHPEFPGAGLWIHLEHDTNTGRPELRLLLDLGDPQLGAQTPVPVYLDRESLTEALGDFRATTYATLTGQSGADVRGGQLDEATVQFAERIDGYVSLAMYLARSEADIVSVDRPGVRPVKPRRPMRDRQTWAVGYST